MVYGQVPPIRGGNTGTIDTSQFGRTGSPYTNPDFLKLLNEQMFVQNFDILFGDEEQRDSSIFGGGNVSNLAPSSSSPMFGGLTGAQMPSDLGGQTTFFNGVSPQFELIARANLIGKTVEAINPVTKQKFSGEVKSVILDGGILLIDIDGIKVPAENLLKVTN